MADSIFSRALKAAVGAFTDVDPKRTWNLLNGALPGGLGMPPQRYTRDYLRSYSQMPWLHAVANKIATAVAQTEWTLYSKTAKDSLGKPKPVRDPTAQRAGFQKRYQIRKDLEATKDLKEIEDHPILDVLNNANGFQTGLQMRKVTQLHIDLTGEGFWLKERDGMGTVVGVWPIPPDWVLNTPTPVNPFFRVGFRAWRGLIPETEFVWFNDTDPVNPYGRGAGTAQSLSDELETDEYAAKHTKAFFYNRAKPDLLIFPKEGSLREDAVKRLETDWMQSNQGFWRAFKPYFMTREVGVHEMDQNFRAMQLVQLRQYERDVILQTFGIPPELLGVLAHSNRATINAADYLMSRYVVQPRLEFMRTILQERLVPEYDDRLILDYESPVERDNEAELAAATAMTSVLTIDEWRAKAGLEPLDGDEGKGFLMAAGFTAVASIGDAIKQGEEAHAAAIAPPPPPMFGGPGPGGLPPKPGQPKPGLPAPKPGQPALPGAPKPKPALPAGPAAPAKPAPKPTKYVEGQARDDHGRFGSGSSGETPSYGPGGVVPGDAARFQKIKAQMAAINNSILPYLDHPDSPIVNQKMREMQALVKEMHTLQVDPGGPEGIGLPGGPRDIAIIGSGPGGMTAGIYAATDGLDTVLIDGSTKPGGQAKGSTRVENYPGFPVGVSGEKLMGNMVEQATRLGADTRFGVNVVSLSHDAATGMKTLTLSNGERIEARAVVIAGGVEFKAMNFPGSDSVKTIYGDGLQLARESAGKHVVVVGGSNGAAQAALGTARAAASTTVLSRSAIEKGMSDYQVQAIDQHPKVDVVRGEVNSVQSGTLRTSDGKELKVDVLGVFIGGAPKTSWLPNHVELHPKSGKINVNHDLETSMPGVFAIGDVRHNSAPRIGAAVGDGAVAVRNIFDYYNRMPKVKP